MKLSTKKYVLEKEYPLPKETVWNLLGDTDRLNLYIGLFPVSFSNASRDGRGMFFRKADAKVAGIVPLSWQEYPFQWEENKHYVVERRYLTGPLKHFVGGVELLELSDDSGAKTLVRLFAEFTPRNVMGIVAIQVTGYQSMKNTLAYLDHYLQLGTCDLHKAPQKSPKHKVNVTELERLENLLRKWPVDSVSMGLLRQYLMEKSDSDVATMKPVLIARQWDTDPDEVLRLFLYATKAGLLNLSWNLICPNCRVSKVEQSSLSQLQQQFHCDLCGINYDVSFDQYVELYFSVHPVIRKASSQLYCVSGPLISPHIKIQKVIEKGETALFSIPEDMESLRLRVIQANDTVPFSMEHPLNSENSALLYTDHGWSQVTVSRQSTVSVHNASSSDIVVVLEQAKWNQDTVSAAKVSAMQEFRDLFSSEVLSPGQSISINHVTILFTDLKDSTSLYETVGDANAYGQVRRHFELLTQVISKNNGAVVKTIGDAVMAVFHSPEYGLRAALQIQQNVSEFNGKAEDEIVLKIGLYSGPAIVVNSNDRLDYFGSTVNMAARIQGQGRGDDIILSAEYMSQYSLSELIASKKVDFKSFQVVLKGIEKRVDLIRLTSCSQWSDV